MQATRLPLIKKRASQSHIKYPHPEGGNLFTWMRIFFLLGIGYWEEIAYLTIVICPKYDQEMSLALFGLSFA